ncbi:Cmx/CmrA family chloramphenicol efflux MFS transporter [Nonomuraea sp. C10]|uniref:Cmx/CmrA family chloramphenicol efflux MFS transporter n=1 Tax=Nonomuraea sp. C10 TaxID=2600577 RepID=UPI0021C3ABB9|nr:Cmx/CmrA family chloramphenicol efflux MFS transporter [Nonomuraea sp. C10]
MIIVPLAVYVLGVAIFAQGTSELMLAGLLPEMAADLGVSVPEAGLLISGFALGMLVGAPVLAVLTLRWPRRDALLAFMAVFAVTHVVGALTSSYGVLLATRVAGAFVYAGFWAVAAVTAIGLVPVSARGRAMSVVAGGLTVATLVGLPAGTLVGQSLGWRAVFWAVAALSALAAAGVLATVPAARPEPPAGGELPLRAQVRALARPQVWLACATTAVSTAALLVVFAYLAALLVDTTGLAPAWVAGVLALYGLGSLIGITLGGRVADSRPFALLFTGLSGVTLVSAGIALGAEAAWAVVPMAFLLGGFGFAVNPALNTRVFALAAGAPALAAAVNVAAFNTGITVGPWLGGLALEAGFGYGSIGWIGAALGLAALGTVALARVTRAPEVQAAPVEPVGRA